jgi:hypothetical protein
VIAANFNLVYYGWWINKLVRANSTNEINRINSYTGALNVIGALTMDKVTSILGDEAFLFGTNNNDPTIQNRKQDLINVLRNRYINDNTNILDKFSRWTTRLSGRMKRNLS